MVSGVWSVERRAERAVTRNSPKAAGELLRKIPGTRKARNVRMVVQVGPRFGDSKSKGSMGGLRPSCRQELWKVIPGGMPFTMKNDNKANWFMRKSAPIVKLISKENRGRLSRNQ